MVKRRRKTKPSIRSRLKQASEERARDLALLADAEIRRALAGEKVDGRQLYYLNEAASRAAQTIGVDKQQLSQSDVSEADQTIEVVLVNPDGSKQPLGSSGSGDSGSSPPAFSSGSFAPRGGGVSFSAPTADELRRIEQTGALETELDALRRAQDRMLSEPRKQSGMSRSSGPHGWLKH
jgi:hypothetical protein